MELNEELDRHLCSLVTHDRIVRPELESRCWRLDFNPHDHAQKASFVKGIKSYFPVVKWSKPGNDHWTSVDEQQWIFLVSRLGTCGKLSSLPIKLASNID
jgi:hypothetical protein